ncbi:MAG: RNA polymerase sigma factor [Ruminococcaceae bacterium]|nr:RNA polymerase sigma factor [Oscillospiraceae bacterium]
MENNEFYIDLNTPEFESAYRELLAYAMRYCRDRDEAEEVVSDTILAYVRDVRAGKTIRNLTGYLHTVFANRYRDRLRRKYRNPTVSDDGSILELIPDDGELLSAEEEQRRQDEIAVRRALGRLARLHREVLYRHYMLGHSVERIAAELDVPEGTVKWRLHEGRGKLKADMERMNDMQKPYGENSYAPKWLSMSIWGSASRRGEPFSCLNSLLAENILIVAYKKPINVSDLAAALGVPAAYVESEVRQLIKGELMGKTSKGLVYTRMYISSFEEALGDIEKQTLAAEALAEPLWEIIHKAFEPLMASDATAHFNEKQKATLWLYLILRSMSEIHDWNLTNETQLFEPYLRPNGGSWMASGIYREQRVGRHHLETSGPYCCRHETKDGKVYGMNDYQSLFGDAHWAYERLSERFSMQEVCAFYASLTPAKISSASERIYTEVEAFEKLHILRRNEAGEVVLDIPYMDYDAYHPFAVKLNESLSKVKDLLMPYVRWLEGEWVNDVPDYVDGRELYLHQGALKCLTVLTMKAIVDKGLLPVPVKVGETPIIVVFYGDSM